MQLETKQTVYKHVINDRGHFRSFITGKYGRIYRVGLKTIPHDDIPYSLLFAYNTLKDAINDSAIMSSFLDPRTTSILECEGDIIYGINSKRLVLNIPAETDIPLYWALQANSMNIKLQLSQPPDGTVLCEWIKPIKNLGVLEDLLCQH